MAASLLLGGCAQAPSALDPKGPAAARIADLGWFMFIVATLVSVFVAALMLFALFRPRSGRLGDLSASIFKGHAVIVAFGIGFPAVVLTALFIWTLHTMNALAVTDPLRTGELTVEVIGQQYWWEVLYPDYGFETANEIRIPVGVPVEIKLASEDVIHSFWVPQLHGKIDMIPGLVNSLIIQADEPGVYYGECAEFCGEQHAKMAFMVVAQPAEEFALWLIEQQTPAPEPTEPLTELGEQVFLTEGCAQCHRIVGTDATGDLGPDLTHIASRLTLAAGTYENNLGNLGGWIMNPQQLKPGSFMPRSDLTGEELQALLAYMATLE